MPYAAVYNSHHVGEIGTHDALGFELYLNGIYGLTISPASLINLRRAHILVYDNTIGFRTKNTNNEWNAWVYK